MDPDVQNLFFLYTLIGRKTSNLSSFFRAKDILPFSTSEIVHGIGIHECIVMSVFK